MIAPDSPIVTAAREAYRSALHRLEDAHAKMHAPGYFYEVTPVERDAFEQEAMAAALEAAVAEFRAQGPVSAALAVHGLAKADRWKSA
jgi:mannose/fructose/N-acetylgalactosamine-specific phosphotransferase system component IID